jgi:hypothetical protein
MNQAEVYVMDIGDQIKVGRTANIEQRVKQIEMAGGRKVRRVFNVPADSIYETLMHEQLDQYRTVGEFFTYSYDDAVALLQKLIAENMAEKARLAKEAARLEKERIRLEEQKARQKEAAERKRERRANAAATPHSIQEESPARPTAVRFNAQEYEFIKKVFEGKGKGLKVSTGIKMAALFIAEQVDAGAISISRAGIIDRRG